MLVARTPLRLDAYNRREPSRVDACTSLTSRLTLPLIGALTVYEWFGSFPKRRELRRDSVDDPQGLTSSIGPPTVLGSLGERLVCRQAREGAP